MPESAEPRGTTILARGGEPLRAGDAPDVENAAVDESDEPLDVRHTDLGFIPTAPSS
jgi:hypothetical protein